MSQRDIKRLKSAAQERRLEDKAFKRADNMRFYLTLLYVVMLALAVRQFVGLPFLVEGSSMAPTLENGERMIVEKLSYYIGRAQRFDIVVCDYPGVKDSRVKRVIGLPGETVQIKDGRVYINDEPLDESAYWKGDINRDMPAHTVSEGSVFVMGDNRNNSTDSRAAHVGDIPYEKIVGRSVLVMWPLEAIRGLTP